MRPTKLRLLQLAQLSTPASALEKEHNMLLPIGLQFLRCSSLFRRGPLVSLLSLFIGNCFVSGWLGSPNLFAAENDPPAVLVGYLPEYRIPAITPQQLAPLTDVMIFSATINRNGQVDTSSITPDCWNQIQDLRAKQNSRWYLTVGGWERSAGFANAAATPQSRDHLAKQLIELCQKHSLAGIDLDWEHPHNETEVANYALLLQLIKQQFALHQLQLSIAVAGWQQLPVDGWNAVDRVHLMAYDNPGEHATYESAVRDIASLTKQGVPAQKIVLGLPLYGRKLANPNEAKSYADIWQEHSPEPSSDTSDGYSFNGRKTVARKAALVIQQHLAGLMVWEVSQDASGEQSLLALMKSELGLKP
jgi:chitinase